MKKGDKALFVIFLLSLALSGIFFLQRKFAEEKNLHAEIMQDGIIVRTIELKKGESYDIPIKADGFNLISVRDGSISITSSDCRNEDCMKMGTISHGGESIICLPNRLSIRISGSSEVDGASY